MWSARLRLLVILPAAAAVVWFAPESPLKGPFLLIALGLPLSFGLVPRNWLYGLRTPRTLSGPDEVWYRQNRITGIVLVIVGLVWLVRAAL